MLMIWGECVFVVMLFYNVNVNVWLLLMMGKVCVGWSKCVFIVVVLFGMVCVVVLLCE